MLMRMLIAATTTPTTTAAHASSGSRFIFPFIVLALAAMWLIVVRPQRRKQKRQQATLSELAIGDEILTAGGVYGKVTRIDDDEVRVEIAPKVEVRVARRAIAAQLTEHAPVAATTASAEPEDASDERWQSAFDAESDQEKPG
jgi:preprotein translocase subunit YajC